MLAVRLPEQIETLSNITQIEIVSSNGTNKFGGRLPDEIKERARLVKDDTEYTLTVFYNNAAAVKWYESEKDRHPVFRETTENGLTGCVHYTEEPRADPEGGSVPMGYYISRADFLLHNLYVGVTTKDRENPKNDKLQNAVNNLAQMLIKATGANERNGPYDGAHFPENRQHGIDPESVLSALPSQTGAEIASYATNVVVPSRTGFEQTDEARHAYVVWYRKGYAYAYISGNEWLRDQISRREKPLPERAKYQGWFDGNSAGGFARRMAEAQAAVKRITSNVSNSPSR